MNLLGETLDYAPMRILAVCLMPNHFHLVLWPKLGSDLSAYMRWLMNAHVRRYHEHYGTRGLGHVWQDRFRNFMVQSDAHLYRVLRYVEGNALRSDLVSDARLWQWSSLSRRRTPNGSEYLTGWPVARPENWAEIVNTGMSAEELRGLQTSARKGVPYGDQWWVRDMVRTHELEYTVRTPGRRRKLKPAAYFGFE